MTVIKLTGLPRSWLACAGALLFVACGSGEPDMPPAKATATADSYALDWNAGMTFAVLDNDLSSGGNAQLSIVEAPKNGSVSVDGKALVYTPKPGFFGADSLRYRLTVSAADFSSSAQSEAAVTLSVQASLTLAGVVSDGPIAGARVVASLGDQAPVSVDADALGVYSLTLKTAQPDAFLTLTATGIGAQTQVVLSSLVGEVSGLASHAVAGKLDSAAAPALRINHLSTAVAGLLSQASPDGKPPGSDKALAELAQKVSVEEMLDAAALIKLVVDHGQALPTGVGNTLQLVGKAGELAAFAAQQRKDNGPQFDLTRSALLDDAQLQSTPPVPVLGSSKSITLLYARGLGGAAAPAFSFELRPDGGAEVVSDELRPATWARDGALVKLTLSEPGIVENFSQDIGPDGRQWLIQSVTTGYVLSDIGAANATFATGTVKTEGHTLEHGGPKMGIKQSFEGFVSSLRRYDPARLAAFKAEDFAVGTRWAGPYANHPGALGVFLFKQDVLTITGADTAQMDRGPVTGTWRLVEGALELSLSDCNYRYRRLGLGPLGEERWLMEQRVDGKLLALREIMAVKAGAVELSAIALTRNWDNNINAAAGVQGQFSWNLSADGMAAATSPTFPTSYDRYWDLLSDGRVYVRAGRTAAGALCKPSTQEPACKMGTQRYWRFVAQQGKTLYVIEQGPFGGNPSETNMGYRFIALTDKGPPL